MKLFELKPGIPVVLFLREPKEKLWGLLVQLDTAGVTLRGLDLEVFDDWMRQEARQEETQLGPTTCFYPLHRLERVEVDETVGPVISYCDRFLNEVGETVREVMGLDLPREETGDTKQFT